jgi:hypothetical protein
MKYRPSIRGQVEIRRLLFYPGLFFLKYLTKLKKKMIMRYYDVECIEGQLPLIVNKCWNENRIKFFR